ncbi:hypothetical protein [Dysgonomonas mossii]|uniref:hypothetical protein n=1 Tax=Dysgonomonas mossii TaxID=163665 RepID=UPI0039925F26
MKKLVIVILLIISVASVYSQTPYDNGWKKGYQEGYCYQVNGCIPPIAPIPPIPLIGENRNDYKAGYQRGFLTGQEVQRNTNSNTNRNSSNSYLYQKKDVTPYIQPYDIELIERSARYNQERLDAQRARNQQVVENAKRQAFIEEEKAKVKAVSKMNRFIEVYNSFKTYPDIIKNGWHEVIAMDRIDFCEVRKVYVESNRISRYIVDGWDDRIVTMSLPIQAGVGRINIKESDELIDIIFINYIANPNSFSTPPQTAYSVSFYTSLKTAGIDIWVENEYLGKLAYYFESATPSPKQKGTLVYTNKAGTYSFKAIAPNGRTWNGTIFLPASGIGLIKLH